MTTKRDTSATAKDQRRGSDRRDGERRTTAERRKRAEAGFPERREGRERRDQGPEGERRKVERRINEYRLRPEVLDFINAINDFKSVNQKPFPTWSEIYDILLSLGYRKVDS